MNEFERARMRRQKSADRYQKLNPEYGKTIVQAQDITPEMVTVEIKTEPVSFEVPKKKETDNNGYLTIQVRCAEVDALIKFRVRSMRGNFPGAMTEASLREVLRKALVSQFGNIVENA